MLKQEWETELGNVDLFLCCLIGMAIGSELNSCLHYHQYAFIKA